MSRFVDRHGPPRLRRARRCVDYSCIRPARRFIIYLRTLWALGGESIIEITSQIDWVCRGPCPECDRPQRPTAER